MSSQHQATEEEENEPLIHQNRKPSPSSSSRKPLKKQLKKQSQSQTCFSKFTNWVYLTTFGILFRHRWVVLVLWLLSLPAAGFGAYSFLKRTSFVFSAPNGSQAYLARMALAQNFKALSSQVQLVVLAETSQQNVSILDDPQCAYLKQLSEYINQSLTSVPEDDAVLETLLGPYWLPDGLVETAAKFNVQDPRLQFTSPDQSAAALVVAYRGTGKKFFSQSLRDIISKFKPQNCSDSIARTYSSDVTGSETMADDLDHSIEDDTSKMDSFAVPLALFVFWFFLKSIRLLILPMLAMLTSILYAMALMLPVSYIIDVSSLAPTMMSSMCLAVSTDYTLFLLTRFNEERKTRTPSISVANMLYHAGHVIITSGFTLAITFAAMLFYPTEFLQSFGAASTLAILCSMFSNLVLSPTLLLCFPKFFIGTCFKCTEKEKEIKHVEFLESPEEDVMLHQELVEQRSSMWYKWVKFWESPIKSVFLIFLVFGATLPVAYFVKDFKTTTDSGQVFASNSRGVQVMEHLKQKFNPGLVAPYRIMTVAKNKTAGIITQQYFNMVDDLYETMNNSGLIGASQILTITKIQDIPISAQDASALLDSSQSEGNPLALPYQYVANQLLNEDHSAAIFTIVVDFDPMSRTSESWIAETRTILKKLSSEYSEFEFYLYGGSIEIVDLVSDVTNQFPYMVGATCFILFLIVGTVFRSVLIPLRGLLTIGLSVAWTFGLAVIIFEKILESQIFWFTPIFAFSIVVGLGLDYDIFLLSRVYEYRDAGFTTAASIVKGTYLTGSIITGAGIIMIIAFISLSVSHVKLIFQFSVILASSVFLDTFVVRTALVPAIMRLCSYANWWPSKYGSKIAEEELGVYGEDYFLDEDAGDSEAGTLHHHVKPHDLNVFLQRRDAVRDIVEEGIPAYYTQCFKRKSLKQKKVDDDDSISYESSGQPRRNSTSLSATLGGSKTATTNTAITTKTRQVRKFE